MKILFIGGVKSGKSLNAEKYILSLTNKMPVYLATTEFIDDGMSERIKQHQLQREEKFITIEEPMKLKEVICMQKVPVLVECLSMWINNMMYHEKSFEEMEEELKKIMSSDKDIVFVLNDVGSGIIPVNKLASEFIDNSGKLSQIVASKCDEVYHTIAGISTKIK